MSDYLALYRDTLGIRIASADPRSGEVRAYCPFHDDQNPSFGFNTVTGLWICRAGCGQGNARQLFARRGQPYPWDDGDGAVMTGVPTPAVLTPDVPTPDSSTIVDTYDYPDLAGTLQLQVVRYEPKAFRQRRPDGQGGWLWNVKGVEPLLYRLPDLLTARQAGPSWVFVPEGEKDSDRLWAVGLPATTNPGGATKWRPEHTGILTALGYTTIIVLPDNDAAGRERAAQVARSCRTAGLVVKIVTLPDLPEKGDVSDWLDNGGTPTQLLALAEAAPPITGTLPSIRWPEPETPAETVYVEDREPAWLEPRILSPGCVTEMFSPRGLGKTLYALRLAVALARQGVRVLVIDRDNPPRVTRRRLRGWGVANAPSLKLYTRDKVPPLTDATAWAAFPYEAYDLVIVDSLDAATEGVGERDSAKPSKALAPLLDIARRDGGPAVWLLGNTVKSALHSRGSGVVEDRADIVFEVRDATGFTPTGKKSWWLELPLQGAEMWGDRADRRKSRKRFRLAFTNTKCRIAEEAEPFVLELDLTTEPWTCRDVTAAVEGAATAARERVVAQQAMRLNGAEAALIGRLTEWRDQGQELLKTDAEKFLREEDPDLTQREAREVLARRINWTIEELKDRPGRPKVLRLLRSPAVAEGAPPVPVARTPLRPPGSA